MDKSILKDYIDACELVKETEEDIRALRKRKKTIVQDVVKGSSRDFPYTEQTVHIEGVPQIAQGLGSLEIEEQLLKQRKDNAQEIKLKVEEWMIDIPMRMQRIIRYYVFQKLSWGEVARKMGRKATADGVKMEFRRFIEKN